MTEGHVVVVDPYSSGAMLAKPLRRAGFTPVAVTSWPAPTATYTHAFRPDEFDAVASAEGGLARLTQWLERRSPLAVVPGAESGVILADRLAHTLTPDRCNVVELTEARRHKGKMVRALAERGLATIPSVCATDPEVVRRWVARRGLSGADLVLKPVLSGGTQGVTLVRRGDGIDRAMDRLLGWTDVFNITNREVLVQQRVFGDEYVVDTFSRDGVHSITNICRYNKFEDATRFAVYESMDFVPLAAPGNVALIAYVKQALDALGVRFGLAHVEVMVTSDGPLLVEVGARVPGAFLPGACTIATGENGISRLVAALAGTAPATHDYTLLRRVRVVYFTQARAGTITNVQAYEQIARLPTCRHVHINVRDGEHIGRSTDLLSIMGLGWALLAHRDLSHIERDHRLVRELEGQVVVTAEPTGGV